MLLYVRSSLMFAYLLIRIPFADQPLQRLQLRLLLLEKHLLLFDGLNRQQGQLAVVDGFEALLIGAEAL